MRAARRDSTLIDLTRWRVHYPGIVALLATLVLVCLFAKPLLAADPEAVRAEQGLVVSVSEPASLAGLESLKKGGTAVDAAVTTAFALAVTWPEAGNIGGGGFMMVYGGSAQSPVCIEYRETAPQSASETMFAGQTNERGHRVVGVPGTVRGMALAHARYGRLPWKDVVMPAVQLAQEGFVINARLAEGLNRLLEDTADFAELRRVFSAPQGGKWSAGDRLIQPDLAKTLRAIAEGGPEVFYRGPVADALVAEMQSGGGLITKEDLARYEARMRAPIRGTYRGYEIYGPPPPSSGGICLVEMLNLLEPLNLRQRDRWSAETLHFTIEAMKRAYCDRARYLGDPEFTAIPQQLITKEYAKATPVRINPTKATPSETLAPELPIVGESDSTTHFSVIDSSGMAVSNTYTLEHSYGSRVVVRGAGFLLNNEMTDFNRQPGRTDRSGTIGTKPNLIAPGKRMLSSQTPTIVVRDRKVVLVVGSPGGRTIINTVLCTLLNVLEFEMDLRAAVDAPRLHHQWLPDKVQLEPGLINDHAEALEKLRAMGHQVSTTGRRQGDVHAIQVRDGVYYGAADQRLSGYAAGY